MLTMIWLGLDKWSLPCLSTYIKIEKLQLFEFLTSKVAPFCNNVNVFGCRLGLVPANVTICILSLSTVRLSNCRNCALARQGDTLEHFQLNLFKVKQIGTVCSWPHSKQRRPERINMWSTRSRCIALKQVSTNVRKKLAEPS